MAISKDRAHKTLSPLRPTVELDVRDLEAFT
eukprot:CAMPEP_0119329708 /NCGR_PEP_ID=MMETSP1333-20130426/76536_1 /TAXON_ID=418940 /ORGANISM="Scyphosphaera apsteinii, Strain RCC1455" /LENGTH=30 /DNA_ID= /DNA_START= /DNA_END= /DNA_ORIENTATION=